MRKIINSATTQYQPVLTEELVLDDKATVGSFNGITSDAVARAVAGASGEVPEVTSGDNGKVLTAVYDAGGPAVEWAEAQGGVPASTVADSGKVLTVDAEGTPAWATAGGGGSSNVEIIDLPQSSASSADILAAYNAAVAAYTANKAIIGKITGSQGNYKYIVCTKVSYGGGNYTFEFSGTMADFPGSTPSVPLYVWAQLVCAPRESYYSMLYKCAPLGVTLQNWNPWYIPE